MGILETIRNPQDLNELSEDQLKRLASEVRAFLITNVSQTGGHLGPNLGVVELTLAVHRIFDSPRDSIVFDTGHQSYVHKLLTGRQDFSTLRQEGGISGYPSRAESEHDIVESSHASSSLSWADGISRARQLTGEGDRYVIAVVGDGALTGGMAWEAINNIAADKKRRVVIVVNDNGRSYAPTVGGFADYLASLRPTIDSFRTAPAYEVALDWWKKKLQNGGPAGQFTYKSLHAMKKGIKDWWAPQGMFEDLGMKYIGPVDGHNLQAMEHALSTAKHYGGPVIVHAMTEKGHGYAPARAHEADQFHAVGIIDPETGEPTGAAGAQSWTSVFPAFLFPAKTGRRHNRRHAHPRWPAQIRGPAPGPRDRRRNCRTARTHIRRRHGLWRAAPRGCRLCNLPEPGLRPAPHGRGPAQGRRHHRP